MQTESSLPPGMPRIERLEVRALAVRRGEAELLSDVDFELHRGEALLLRGRNGAGKSSLLLTLAGLLRPAHGTIALVGRDAERSDGEHMHLVAHRSAIKARLTLAENLHFWAALQGGEEAAIAPALDAMGLGGLADVDAGHLSAGQTRRLALARLLVSPRPLWLLDEPTSALDAEGHLLVGALIDAQLRAGGMVIAATHDDIALAPDSRVRTLDIAQGAAVAA